MDAQILIVDDNIQNLEFTVDVLIQVNVDVYTAKSGADALNILKENAIDLVLLDIQMPEMDGFECLNQIRNIPECKETPHHLLNFI